MNNILDIIHPKWLIEEKAINFRRDLWFSPPNLPKIIEKKINKLIKKKFIQYEIIIKGAIFCHVIKIIFLFQLRPSITLGNQKWKGATPLFISKLEEISIIILLL